MTALFSNSTNICENLAFEEFLFFNSRDEYFLVYFNAPSVVIGLNQNIFAEASLPFVRRHGIPVIRRITGGGAVYHDTGNLNFSLISNHAYSDYTLQLTLVCEFLKTIGLQGRPAKSNSVFVGDLKVSGHAQHVSRNRRLAHGTLLLNTDLTLLKKSLDVPYLAFHHSVRSIRSTTGNICSLTPYSTTAHTLSERFMSFINEYFRIPAFRQVNPASLDDVKTLADEKYNNWKWNIGRTKFFTLVLSLSGNRQVEIQSEGGIILSVTGNTIPESIKTGLRLDEVLTVYDELD